MYKKSREKNVLILRLNRKVLIQTSTVTTALRVIIFKRYCSCCDCQMTKNPTENSLKKSERKFWRWDYSCRGRFHIPEEGAGWKCSSHPPTRLGQRFQNCESGHRHHAHPLSDCLLLSASLSPAHSVSILSFVTLSTSVYKYLCTWQLLY